MFKKLTLIMSILFLMGAAAVTSYAIDANAEEAMQTAIIQQAELNIVNHQTLPATIDLRRSSINSFDAKMDRAKKSVHLTQANDVQHTSYNGISEDIDKQVTKKKATKKKATDGDTSNQNTTDTPAPKLDAIVGQMDTTSITVQAQDAALRNLEGTASEYREAVKGAEMHIMQLPVADLLNSWTHDRRLDQFEV